MKTLIVPYLIWIIITWGGTVLPMIIPGLKNYVNGTTSLNPSIQSFVSTLFTGNDTHLWFLNKLIIISVFMPLIFELMRYKRIGSIVLVVLFALSSVLSKDNTDWKRIAFFYLAGVYVAFDGGKEFSFRYIRLIGLILFLVFSALETAILSFDVAHQLETILLLLMMMSLYCILSDRSWSIKDRSFWLYLSHGVVIVYLKKIVYVFFPKINFIAMNCFVALPIIIIFAMNFLSMLVERVTPKAYSVMVGGRIGKSEGIGKQL